MVGGDKDSGRAAIYLGDSFYRGSSSSTACFDNQILSGETEFNCVELEVWSL